uniref:Uncharacterized protein n=1 Tax=Arundo donax TaxID=35708 RepID=A0A0A9GVP4_ARUDO
MVHRDHRCLPHGCLFPAIAASSAFVLQAGEMAGVKLRTAANHGWCGRLAVLGATKGERDGKSSETHRMASIPQLPGLATR